MRLRLAALAFLLLPQAAAQAQPKLELPVACTLGQDCYVQNYVDHDGGPGWKDFTCGPLSYDKHTGTDIAMTDPTAWRRGVTIRAAAPGRVVGVRDGMQDHSRRAPAPPDITDRDCGNRVGIQHGNGWLTQYCHLKQGSVSVKDGDLVTAGTPLGQMGMSGRADFPHIHIQLVRQSTVFDPFSAEPATTGCGLKPNQFWANPQPYIQTGSIGAGFATEMPVDYRAWQGDYAASEFTGPPPQLLFWGMVFGIRKGDVPQLRLTLPSGQIILSPDAPWARDQAVAMQVVGTKARDGSIEPGTYRAEYRLLRAGRPVVALRREAVVK